MTLNCPAHIDFLLWCHVSPERHPKFGLKLYEELIPQLLSAGVIEADPEGDMGVFRTTAKGKAWVRLLCDTPEPKVVFADQQGKVIEV